MLPVPGLSAGCVACDGLVCVISSVILSYCFVIRCAQCTWYITLSAAVRAIAAIFMTLVTEMPDLGARDVMSNYKLKCSVAVLVAGLVTASQTHAGFEIEGNTIVFTDNDWYQVQTPDTFVTICNGASSCTVASGTYIVINHNTGERWESVPVPPDASNPVDADPAIGDVMNMPTAPPGSFSIDGNLLGFSNNDWYQVQRSSDFQTVCEGVDSCLLEEGTYIVVNHSSGQRYEGVMIGPAQGAMNDNAAANDNPGSADNGMMNNALLRPLFDGDSVRWPDDGWYQLQNASDFSTVCEGGLACAVGSGSYILVNLSTGERWENFEVVAGIASTIGDDATVIDNEETDAGNADSGNGETTAVDVDFVPSPAPIVEGNTLILGGTGWYQVQSATDFTTFCSGLFMCEVPRGVYNVINHSTGERFTNISVFDNSGVWFGTTSFGEGVFVIGNDGSLYGLSSRDDGLYESVFGRGDGTVQRYLHLASRNTDHGTSFNLLGERPENFNTFDMNEVMYNLAVNNEGQQLTNSGIGGNFSLTFATADDVMPIDLQSVAGQWESRSAFCPTDCDITVVLDIANSGFLSGSTQVNDGAPAQLAGSLAVPGDSDLYLQVEYLLNGDRRAGVVYFDRFSDALILNSIGVDNNTGSLSAIFQRN